MLMPMTTDARGRAFRRPGQAGLRNSLYCALGILTVSRENQEESE